MKCLKSDRGGEFYNPSFLEYTGIIHQTTALYSPQHNGKAGRKNKVLEEMANAKLSHWGEAMLIACSHIK